VNRRLVVELGGRFPYLAAGGAGVNLNGIHYSTTAMTYGAFPSGTPGCLASTGPRVAVARVALFASGYDPSSPSHAAPAQPAHPCFIVPTAALAAGREPSD
jgi:hypothetical protein